MLYGYYYDLVVCFCIEIDVLFGVRLKGRVYSEEWGVLDSKVVLFIFVVVLGGSFFSFLGFCVVFLGWRYEDSVGVVVY